MAEKGTSGSARVLYYDGTNNTLTVIGTLTGVNHGGGGVDEQGLVGIALNPVTFGQDNYLYLNYAVGAVQANGSATVGWRVSRFTLNPTTKMMDMGSEKILLHIPAGTSARWHTAGAMQMDNFGNLYITAADNEALANGPGNTADLRGSILRIRPDTSARGYSIPAGNFGEYWAQKWQDSGLTTRAEAYRDTSIVKPEIYIKGSRNPYGLSLDKGRLGWISWSECGPDQQRGEEHNFATAPVFSGWPFWAGKAVRQSAKAGSYDEPNEPATWGTFNPASMTTQVPYNNHAPALGYDTLPPMHRPSLAYTPTFFPGTNANSTNSSCAQGGPIIRYDGTVSNPGKMPPHLNNVAMYSDLTGSSFHAVKISTATGATLADTATSVFTMTKTGRPNLNNPVDFQQGPDGALYVVDWGGGCCSASPTAANAGIVRISYTGTCSDPGLTTSIDASKPVHRGGVSWLRVGASRITLRDDGSGRIATGAHIIRILDVSGRELRVFRGDGVRSYELPALGGGALYVLRAETAAGTVVQTFSHL
jgi:cytochrome c